ncbi:MAG: hypothetical protein V3U60_01220 [Gammaproteobacteria bacterium]
MKNTNNRYAGQRYPIGVINHAIWLYNRFTLSFHDVEELLAIRSIDASYKSIRQWCLKFGHRYAKRIRSRTERPGDTWHLDEVFILIRGERHYL